MNANARCRHAEPVESEVAVDVVAELILGELLGFEGAEPRNQSLQLGLEGSARLDANVLGYAECRRGDVGGYHGTSSTIEGAHGDLGVDFPAKVGLGRFHQVVDSHGPVVVGRHVEVVGSITEKAEVGARLRLVAEYLGGGSNRRNGKLLAPAQLDQDRSLEPLVAHTDRAVANLELFGSTVPDAQ